MYKETEKSLKHHSDEDGLAEKVAWHTTRKEKSYAMFSNCSAFKLNKNGLILYFHYLPYNHANLTFSEHSIHYPGWSLTVMVNRFKYLPVKKTDTVCTNVRPENTTHSLGPGIIKRLQQKQSEDTRRWSTCLCCLS